MQREVGPDAAAAEAMTQTEIDEAIHSSSQTDEGTPTAPSQVGVKERHVVPAGSKRVRLPLNGCSRPGDQAGDDSQLQSDRVDGWERGVFLRSLVPDRPEIGRSRSHYRS